MKRLPLRTDEGGLLTLQLPSGQKVRYESSRSWLPLTTIRAFEAAVEAARPLVMSEGSAGQ